MKSRALMTALRMIISGAFISWPTHMLRNMTPGYEWEFLFGTSLAVAIFLTAFLVKQDNQ